MKERKGIDISHHNGTLDFNMLKVQYGYEFAILKLGTYTSDKFLPDPMFRTYADECERNNIPYGSYVYLNKSVFYFDSVPPEYIRDTIHMLWGRKLDYPLYLDVEEQNIRVAISHRTKIITDILHEWESFGFYAGIYSSPKAGFDVIFQSEYLETYTWWIASWTNKPILPYGIWQYASGKTTESGLDEDVTHVDFPTAIKKNKLNGYW